MYLLKCAIIVTICVQANGFDKSLVPPGKEVVYKWNAKLIVGTQFPAIYGSGFTLDGNIRLQSNNNITYVKISELTYKIYNGHHNHVKEKETKSFPLPEGTNDLQKVFKIVYGNNGLVHGISTAADEKEFSRNIKRSLATILQLDDSVFTKGQNKSESFIVRENSIYGYSSFVYDIMPKFGGIAVHKFHEMSSPRELYRYVSINVERLKCDVPFEEPVMRKNMKRYLIVKQDGHNVVKRFTTDADIIYYPFQAKSDYQIVKTLQSFELVEVVPIEQHLSMESEHFQNHVNYHPAGINPDGSVNDITNGRRNLNRNKLVQTVQKLIRQICEDKKDYLQKVEIENTKAKQIYEINDILSKLNAESFEEIRSDLLKSDKCLINIFYKTLPLAGTEASTLYIKELIVNKKVNDATAINLLANFPENVKLPTKDLVTKLEELIHVDENFDWEVKKTAILSFATLVHKSDTLYRRLGQSKTKKTENLKTLFYEKYVLEYVDKIKTSKDYGTQFVYFCGLANMKLQSIENHLLPAVNGEWWESKRLRFLSIWTVAQSVLNDPNPDAMINTLWPIFINRQEITELRILAYYCIMKSQPDDSRLRNIAHAMAGEPDREVYRFHYTYVKSIMLSNDPCKQNLRIKMAHMLKDARPLQVGHSSVQRYDYRDASFDFSSSLEYATILLNDTRVYHLEQESQKLSILNLGYAFYLKLNSNEGQGLDISSLQDNLTKTESTNTNIEAVIKKGGNIIRCFYFDKKNINTLRSLWNIFEDSFENTFLNIDYENSLTAMMPIDLGVPVFWEFQMPELVQNNFVFKKNSDNADIENTFAQSIHFRHGLTTYNPFLDAWQGINRVNNFDLVVPLNLNIALTRPLTSLKITWKKHKDPVMNVVGLKVHAKNAVFVKFEDEEKLLSESNPHSKPSVTVDYEENRRSDYPIVEKDELATGHKWYIGFFDSSKEVSSGDFKDKLYHWLQPNTKEFSSPLEHLILSFANFQKFALMAPIPGTYGFLMTKEASKQHAVTEISLELSIRGNQMSSEILNVPPGTPLQVLHFTYDVRSNDESINTWEANLVLGTNVESTVNEVNIDLTRKISGQKDSKISLRGVKKWASNDVTGHLNLKMCQTVENNCTGTVSVIEVTMTGKRSPEQDSRSQYYGACQNVKLYHEPDHPTIDCLVSRSTVRDYTYNVKTLNIPSEVKDVAAEIWDHFKNYHYRYYSHQGKQNYSVEDNNMKISIKYLMQTDTVNIHLTTSQDSHSLLSVPTDYLKWFGLVPDPLISLIQQHFRLFQIS